MTARFDDLMEFGQDADVVVDVLDHVQSDNAVEATVAEGRIGDRSADETANAACLGIADRLGRAVDADRLAVGFEAFEHLTGTATGVEDTKRSVPSQRAKDIGDEVEPPAEPPVG